MNTIKSTIKIFLLLGLFTGACEKESGSPQGIQQNNDLNAISDPLPQETTTFTNVSNTNTLIKVELEGTATGDFNLNHKHVNQAIDAGGDTIDLNNETEISDTLVTQINDAIPINHEELLKIDGHANVHFSTTSFPTLIARENNDSNHLKINTINP